MRFRDYKNLTTGNYYHIFNRGNNKQPICIDEQDFLNFFKRLYLALGLTWKQQGPSLLKISPLPKDCFTFVSYCLMPNHFHFFIRQNTNISISKLITKVCTSYSMYFNKKYLHIGHVFQGKFKAKLVENDSYFKYLSA